MDRVKLGRALGYGTRHAAKTLAAVAAATAAPAPNPNDPVIPPASVISPAAAPHRSENPRPAPVPLRSVPTQARVAGRSVLAPLATFSGALWLRVTGCFFALIAFTMLSGAWRARAALHPGSDAGSLRHFWMFAAFGVLFGYFAVSSFVRASLRERRSSTITAR